MESAADAWGVFLQELPVLAIERKKNILNILRANKTLNVNELAERFNLSKETIRRDLREFERQGLLKKTHGGAVLARDETASSVATFLSTANPDYSELPIDLRRETHSGEKELICKVAASRLRNKEVIYIDNSSTSIPLVHFIPPDISVTVITNSLIVIMEAYKLGNPNISLFCVPGFFNSNNLSLYGNQTVKMVEEFFPSKAFISCAGILPDSRLADTSMYEIDTKRSFMRKSETVFLLADADKFNKSAPYLLSDMDLVDCIVTDKLNPKFNWQLLDSMGVEVVIAGDEP